MADMNVVCIGNDPKVYEAIWVSIGTRWSDATVVTTDTAAGLELVESASPDIVLLYPDFTDMPMAQIIQELRGFSDVSLLVLGDRADDDAIKAVTALAAGADNYVRLPCDLSEIATRVWALLRRNGLFHPNSEQIGLGPPLQRGRRFINPSTYEAFLNDKPLILTTIEFRLLHLLARNRHTVVTHQALGWLIWGQQSGSSGLVKKCVQRLRRKLHDDAREPRWIASVHGVGYRFIGPAPDAQTAPKLAARAAV